jgi:hypothetical protein
MIFQKKLTLLVLIVLSSLFLSGCARDDVAVNRGTFHHLSQKTMKLNVKKITVTASISTLRNCKEFENVNFSTNLQQWASDRFAACGKKNNLSISIESTISENIINIGFFDKLFNNFENDYLLRVNCLITIFDDKGFELDSFDFYQESDLTLPGDISTQRLVFLIEAEIKELINKLNNDVCKTLIKFVL